MTKRQSTALARLHEVTSKQTTATDYMGQNNTGEKVVSEDRGGVTRTLVWGDAGERHTHTHTHTHMHGPHVYIT